MTLAYRERAHEDHGFLEESPAEVLREKLEAAGIGDAELARAANAGIGLRYDFEDTAMRMADALEGTDPVALRELSLRPPEEAGQDGWSRLCEGARRELEYRSGPPEEWLERWPEDLRERAGATHRLASAVQGLMQHPGAGIQPERWGRMGAAAEVAAGDLRRTGIMELSEEESSESLRWIGGRLAVLAAEAAEARTKAPGTAGHSLAERAGLCAREEWNRGNPGEEDPSNPGMERIAQSLAELKGLTPGDEWQDTSRMDTAHFNLAEKSALFALTLREDGYVNFRQAVGLLMSDDWLQRAHAQEKVGRALERFESGGPGDRQFLVKEAAEGAAEHPGPMREYCRELLNFGAMGSGELARGNSVTKRQGELELVTGDMPGHGHWLEESRLMASTAEATYLLRISPGKGAAAEGRVLSDLFNETRLMEQAWHRPMNEDHYRGMEDARRKMILTASKKAVEQLNRSSEHLSNHWRADQSPEARALVERLSERQGTRMKSSRYGDSGEWLEATADCALVAAQLDWSWRTGGLEGALEWEREQGGGLQGPDPEGFPKRVGEALRSAAEAGRLESERMGEKLSHQEHERLRPLEFVQDDGGRPLYWSDAAGDCVTRAIAVMTGREDYTEIWNRITELKDGRGDPTGDADNSAHFEDAQRVMAERGLARLWEAYGSPWDEMLDINEVLLATGGRDCVVSQNSHLAAVKDGALHDTFNWGASTVREGLTEIHVRVEELEEARSSLRDYLRQRTGRLE